MNTVPCPYCGAPTTCDTVDIGIGWQQCGPYGCESCGASEIPIRAMPYDATPEERRTGWYRPDRTVFDIGPLMVEDLKF